MKALTKKDLTENSFIKQMEELGRKMVKHCKGLPLAIVVLGGILVTKPSLTEWEVVFDNVERSLRKGRGLGQEHQREVLEMLVLSYTDLPYQLKLCFIYLGTFLEDSVIKAEKLYQMWMAEGLLLKKDRREGETMMDVAECYLGELAHRCMVGVKIEADESYIRKFKSCRIHDLVRDLSISKAEEEDFFKPLDYRHDNQLLQSSSSSSINYTRRLVVNHTDKDITSKHISLDNEVIRRHLRSLLFTVTDLFAGRMPQILRSDLAKFMLLRVLSMEGILLDMEPTLKEACCYLHDDYKRRRAIGCLKHLHLRYLSLRGSYSQMFPSLANKEYLQTLDLRIVGDVVYVLSSTTKSMLKGMGRLRPLYLPRGRVEVILGKNKLRLNDLRNLERWGVDEGAMPCLSELKIDDCPRLKMLPDGMIFLTAFKDMEINYMPEVFNDRNRVVNGKEGEDFHKVRHIPSITFRSMFE